MCHIMMTRFHSLWEAFVKNAVLDWFTLPWSVLPKVITVNSLSKFPTSRKLRHLSILSSSQQASKELTEVLNQIWSLDANRLRPGTDYVISLQVRNKSLKLSHMVQICDAWNGVLCSKKTKLFFSLLQIHNAPVKIKNTPLPQLFDKVFIIYCFNA